MKVPAGIPAYILSRRPDVRQSEYQLRAAKMCIRDSGNTPALALAGQLLYAKMDLAVHTDPERFAACLLSTSRCV